MTRLASLAAFTLALVTTRPALAAQVLWDCFQQIGFSEIDIGCYEPEGVPVWADMSIKVSTGSSTVTMTPKDEYVLVGRWNWVLAELGDIACEATTQHLDSYFICHSTEGTEGAWLGDPIPATKGSSIYMMVMAELAPEHAIAGLDISSMPPYFSGWVELQVGQDGVVRLASSALDLDGGPMIVGGGSATPEPSSVLLLILGTAALLLKRRHYGA